jgi:rifampicin phosphotransferase
MTRAALHLRRGPPHVRGPGRCLDRGVPAVGDRHHVERTAGVSASTSRARQVIPLGDLAAVDRQTVGSKAANLGELMRAGFSVPDGFAIIGEPDEAAVRSAAERLGDGAVAVRSSAVAEDLADASFAGQYETVLGVRGPDALLDAIHQVRASAQGSRLQHYRATRADSGSQEIAVLVQRMVTPDAAGVEFTANPVTGRRDEVVITAARGLGERVVSGEAIGDEWVVRDGQAECRRSVEQAIDAQQAVAVAGLARRAEKHFGAPQDIEWAIEDGQLYLLQARPMTALPEPADWTPPGPGYWMRTFRLGEWLTEPMTPLFEDWLLERIEDGYLDGMRRDAGTALPFRHGAINGCYYTATPMIGSIPLALLRGIIESRGRVLSVVLNGLVRPSTQPETADRALLHGLAVYWRELLLPCYRQAVADGERRVDSEGPAELEDLVDAIGCLAGEYLWSLAIVGGSAWKMEGCLAGFLRREMARELQRGMQVLLRGLPGAELAVAAYAVQSVDWYWPTAGEQQTTHDAAQVAMAARREQLQAERERAEAVCREVLADRPAVLARFETLLEVAQRYAVLREEQSRSFTLGWPLLRRCALRLGELAVQAGTIERSEDVFFLTRGELRARTNRQDAVANRRALWERQRRLIAPLTIGQAPRLLERSLTGAVEAVRSGGRAPEGAIVGEPASPGRATGRVRVVRDAAEFDRFEPGEVLVAQATAPAWTALFGRAAAVVTDGGTLAAHASLVAREFGIPAMVATGDATRRLRTGQLVTVDGSAGFVAPRREESEQ